MSRTEQLHLAFPIETEALSLNPSQAELTQFAKRLLRQAGASRALLDAVSVRWNSRLSSTAGLAYPGQSKVVLNPALTEMPEELDRTLRHELAHLLARQRAGRRRIQPHGDEWKVACRDLGIPGESRCHTLPLPRRRVTKKLQYRCPNCGLIIDRVRPIQKAAACRKCCRDLNRGKFSAAFQFVAWGCGNEVAISSKTQ